MTVLAALERSTSRHASFEVWSQGRRICVGLAPWALAIVTACGSSSTSEPPRTANVDADSPKQIRTAKALTGTRAPAFSLPSATGSDLVLVPSREVTVLIFVGIWSHGSTRGLAQLETLRRKHEGKGLRVLAVSMDETKEDAARFAEARDVHFPIAWAGGMVTRTSREWGSGPYGGENSVFVLDRAGVVRFVHPGGKDDCAAGRPEVDDEIVQLLAEATSPSKP